MPKRVQLLPLGDDLTNISEEFIKQVVSTLPEEMSEKANQLLKSLHSMNVLVTQDGRINYAGQEAATTGSSLMELLQWVLSEKKSPLPPDYQLFKKLLSNANLPEGFFPNKRKSVKPVVAKKYLKSTDNSNKWLSSY